MFVLWKSLCILVRLWVGRREWCIEERKMPARTTRFTWQHFFRAPLLAPAHAQTHKRLTSVAHIVRTRATWVIFIIFSCRVCEARILAKRSPHAVLNRLLRYIYNGSSENSFECDFCPSTNGQIRICAKYRFLGAPILTSAATDCGGPTKYSFNSMLSVHRAGQ